MLHHSSGSLFCSDQCEYAYRPATIYEKQYPRIIVTVRIAYRVTEAVLDTGAPWCVCSPEFRDDLEQHASDKVTIDSLNIRGTRYDGALYRVPIELVGDNGGISLEGTVFLPDVSPEEWPNLPSFIGLSGCLERIRFAIDPSDNTWYFGSLGAIDQD